MKYLNVIRHHSKLVRPGQQNTIYIEKSKLDAKLHSKIPLICLMGWTGARDSHLKKYSQIYSDLGYHTLRFSPTNKLTFLQTKQHKKYTLDLMSQLNENFPNNPIMFHFFSNACLFIFYQHIIRDINQHDYRLIKSNEKGQIYDSGLGLTVSYIELFKGIANLLEADIKNSLMRYLISFSMVSLYRCYTIVTFNNNYFTKGIETIVDDNRKLPALYLLSNSDKLIDHVDIKKNIANRLRKFSLNNDYYTKVKAYEDADHVLLYAKYPNDYIEQLTQHLKICNLEIKNLN